MQKAIIFPGIKKSLWFFHGFWHWNLCRMYKYWTVYIKESPRKASCTFKGLFSVVWYRPIPVLWRAWRHQYPTLKSQSSITCTLLIWYNNTTKSMEVQNGNPTNWNWWHLKKQSDLLFSSLGLDTSTAIRHRPKEPRPHTWVPATASSQKAAPQSILPAVRCGGSGFAAK